MNDNNIAAGNTIAPKPAVPSLGASPANILTLEGLGDLRIDRPVPAGS